VTGRTSTSRCTASWASTGRSGWGRYIKTAAARLKHNRLQVAATAAAAVDVSTIRLTASSFL
jgi:hypothetical protein